MRHDLRTRDEHAGRAVDMEMGGHKNGEISYDISSSSRFTARLFRQLRRLVFVQGSGVLIALPFDRDLAK